MVPTPLSAKEGNDYILYVEGGGGVRHEEDDGAS